MTQLVQKRQRNTQNLKSFSSTGHLKSGNEIS